jgi:hypothetical protein
MRILTTSLLSADINFILFQEQEWQAGPTPHRVVLYGNLQQMIRFKIIVKINLLL